MKKKIYTGINIQYPISKLILNRKKTVETRTYPIPTKYIGKEMLMIETPGKTGKFKSRIVAMIKFSKCFQYKNSEEFQSDIDNHKVSPDSIWAWSNEKPKWGWNIVLLKVFVKTRTLNKKIGIRYTTNIEF